MSEGLPIIKYYDIKCVVCAIEKQHRNEFPNPEEKKQNECLELIHTNVCEPMYTLSLGGS